jgi:hypothetical protein
MSRLFICQIFPDIRNPFMRKILILSDIADYIFFQALPDGCGQGMNEKLFD